MISPVKRGRIRLRPRNTSGFSFFTAATIIIPNKTEEDGGKEKKVLKLYTTVIFCLL